MVVIFKALLCAHVPPRSPALHISLSRTILLMLLPSHYLQTGSAHWASHCSFVKLYPVQQIGEALRIYTSNKRGVADGVADE
jgi:hypothetical protein